MPLIKDIEDALPLVAVLPEEWQKGIALEISKIMLAYDRTLTMSPEELRIQRDQEIAEGLERPWLPDTASFSATDRNPRRR